MLPAHQLQGELAISVPRYRHPRATITAGKGWGICRPCMSVPTRTVPTVQPCESWVGANAKGGLRLVRFCSVC